ncbi:MAG: hypothetical protein ACYS47_19600 [Planctomycetota bacterium]|jgi:hypothetical protein
MSKCVAFILPRVVLTILGASPGSAWAEEVPTEKAVDESGSKPEEPAKKETGKIDKGKSEALTAELKKLLDQGTAPPGKGSSGSSIARALDLWVNAVIVAGSSTMDVDRLPQLQGGAHDPHRTGFNLQGIDLGLAGSVDPHFRGILLLNLSEESIEIEEGYVRTQNLPLHLEVKAGLFFTDFGRINAQHAHAWRFLDFPVILSRILGPEGLNPLGVAVSLSPPEPWNFRLTLGAHSPFAGGHDHGDFEPLPSFLVHDDETIEGIPLTEGEILDPRDLLYSSRLAWQWAPSGTFSLGAGASGLFGRNSSGGENLTTVFGVDLHGRWLPGGSGEGAMSVAWQFEGAGRVYPIGTSGVDEDDRYEDYGLVAQVVRDLRHRFSVLAIWRISSFSNIRLQYNFDHARFLRPPDGLDAHSIWLGIEFQLGVHAPP